MGTFAPTTPAPLTHAPFTIAPDPVPTPEPAPPPPQAAYLYLKIANGGTCTWRPAISEVQLFSDTACKTKISIPKNGGWDSAATACPSSGCDLCSGWDDVYGNLNDRGCQLAIDGSDSTSWRPHGGGNTFQAGSVWMVFRLPSSTVVQCVKAPKLGQGGGG